MQNLIDLLAAIYNFMCEKHNLWGYDFSFWQVFVFTVVAGALFYVVGNLLNPD